MLHLTFGCAVKGTGLANIDSGTLRTIKPLKECHISLYPLTMRADTIQAWTEALEKNIVRMESSDLDIARGEHKKWWKHFWDKSYIYISGGREAEAVTQGYIFQRYMNACAGRGGYPIKFNGSIFTMDTVEKIADTKYGADYRRWGGPYWFQNTRLIYWPMLSSGDFEMMRPLFRMYLDVLPLAKYRTERYYGHSGAFFPETMCFWGTYANKDYGWDREGIPDGFVQNPYIRYYWSGAIELCVMMLEYYRYTQDMDFAEDSLLPMADAVIEFYDKHFDRGADGKIVFYPAMALETWHDVKNPAPEIAGLGYILRMLLALPRELAGKVRQQRWIRLQNEIPSIPQGEKNGKECLLPAEKLVQTIRQNWENPELYSVFPYKLYGAGREGMQKALDTFDMRDIRDNGCWHQDAIHAACLGLIEESKKMVVQSFSAWCKECRFPGFWGPGSDWVPDMDHGGAASIALQAMLLQVDGDRMLLLPAWPREWDVECRMYGPCNTIIKLRLRDGFIEELDIEPRENRKNVSIINFTTA
ncbi:MAG: hypothetical protein FIA99_04235 [Ruminiclostridium sp.]|nr:hypothetical protein [Ruminiclostridium sp.]